MDTAVRSRPVPIASTHVGSRLPLNREDFLLLPHVDGGPGPGRTLGGTLGVSLAGLLPC